MADPIQLTAEEVAQLRSATRAERLAKQALELAKARLTVAFLEAAELKNAAIDTLADKYRFDRDAPFAVDFVAGTLTPGGPP